MSTRLLTRPSRTLNAVRANRPLVHCITNFVAMDITANALLATGASPVMAHASEEVGDFVTQADALSINIGTLSPPWVEAMREAGRKASEIGSPWVLDPVGVGSTRYRGDVAGQLLRLRPNVVRANGSEILALAGQEGAGRGVDAADGSVEALDAALDLARSSGAVVAVTGAVDYVTDGKRLTAVANGHPMMARVTAIGCALSAYLAACLAVERDAFCASVHALAIFGVVGELAGEAGAGPGSFRVAFLDRLYDLSGEVLDQAVRIE